MLKKPVRPFEAYGYQRLYVELRKPRRVIDTYCLDNSS
jgi:hypothetical protein